MQVSSQHDQTQKGYGVTYGLSELTFNRTMSVVDEPLLALPLQVLQSHHMTQPESIDQSRVSATEHLD